MAAQEWVITVSDQYVECLDEVVSDLEAVGLRTSGVLRSLGQITGETASTQESADSVRQELAAVDGVASVDAAQQYRVPPIDPDGSTRR